MVKSVKIVSRSYFRAFRFHSLMTNKRATSAWISWVLIMAFAVALSAFMYSFMIDYTEDSQDKVKEVVYNTDECRLASLSIEDVCTLTSAQDLNITLQNRAYVRIDKIDFRVYNGHVPIHTIESNTSLNPNRKKLVRIDTNTTNDVTFVEVIPHIYENNMDIICSDKKVTSDVIVCS